MRKVTVQDKGTGFVADPIECPFREFKDAELSPEFWGLGTSAFRNAPQKDKSTKPLTDVFWVDDDIQPLPKSIRFYLDGWERAETLASSRFEAEVSIFNENDGGKISACNYVINYLQILQRSSFCRKVLCSCFILENIEGITVEHQWDGFSFNFGTEGWRPKFHIYSPGMKSGGGQQHRPVLSKNGCYLVRLYYLGCWRCVWVDDQVPIDASGAPLLPFSPLVPSVRSAPVKGKQPVVPTTKIVLLWPVLLCKALLKLWVPDMNSEVDIEDEEMAEFNIIHALTGGLSVDYKVEKSELWQLLKREVPEFAWDYDANQNANNAAKAKPVKKPTTKESPATRRPTITSILMADTKDEPVYRVPGVTPSHEMDLMLTMIRDVPLKKPISEPEVPLWKTYRWVDWARSHGLYDLYECPRDKYLKCVGLLKLSYSPHMLDVTSAESIAAVKTVETRKTLKDANPNDVVLPKANDELKEWIHFESISVFIKSVNVTYFPSMLNFASVGSAAPVHINKVVSNKCIDVQAPKHAPVYLQIDAGDPITVQFGFNVCHPRILTNCGNALDYVPPGHMVLEKFEWFDEAKTPEAFVFLETRGYDNVEVNLDPGRHVFRLWVNSRLHWNCMVTSEANVLLGTRDVVQAAAVKECAWSNNFLLGVSTAFANWIRGTKSATQMLAASRDFYSSYLPDLPWVNKVVGQPRPLLHWMFKQALQSVLLKRLGSSDYQIVCGVFRRLFYDPDFGFIEKYTPPVSSQYSIENTDYNDILNEFDEYVHQIEKREELTKHNVAATIIQTYWRKYRVSKCFTSHIGTPNDVQKTIMDVAFGNLESLSILMNEFFKMYPGAKSAYSVASALTGSTGFQQYSGTTKVTAKCKWIPFFQGVFFCHRSVKVNFDLKSNLQRQTLLIFNNDTMKKVNTEFYTSLTQDFLPNLQGYTIIGHASLDKGLGYNFDAYWNLSVLCSSQYDFHICDSPNINLCRELPLQLSTKVHIEEIFVPNRRNILGTIHLTVTKFDCVSFRAATSVPELEIVATLQTFNETGDVQILDKCKGNGELYWPIIILQGPSSAATQKRATTSSGNITSSTRMRSFRSIKSMPKSPKGGSARGVRSNSKLDTVNKKGDKSDIRFYTIEVSAPYGWPLSIPQWLRVEEHKNSFDVKSDGSQKKPKERIGSAKERQQSPPNQAAELRPGDPFTELEVSITVGGSVIGKRDDSREVAFAEARKSWDAKEPGRNVRGAKIRKDFRDQYLAQTLSAVQSNNSLEEVQDEIMTNDDTTGECTVKTVPYPTPASETVIQDLFEELYIDMPEQLKDKFEPLDFVPECTLEDIEQKTILTPEMYEAAEIERESQIHTTVKRMQELQQYNEIYILGRQRRRAYLLEKLFVDASLPPSIVEAFERRALVKAAHEALAADKAKKK